MSLKTSFAKFLTNLARCDPYSYSYYLPYLSEEGENQAINDNNDDDNDNNRI